MDTKKITDCLSDNYDKQFTTYMEDGSILYNAKPQTVRIVPLLEKLTKEQLYQLQEGDGNPIAEMYQINSSAGLAVNYYKLFEKTHKGVMVEFEWKKYKPLCLQGNRGRMANLDVRYEIGNEVHFVESKFLEPYYQGKPTNHSTTDSYFKEENHPEGLKAGAWMRLIEEAEGFKYYDCPQLCRHLMAIYRSWRERRYGEDYDGKAIILESNIWGMSDGFADYYLNTLNLTSRDMDSRRNVIDSEKKACQNLFDGFLDDNNLSGTFKFQAHYYNDKVMLDAIRGASRFDSFKKQYFIEEGV